MDETATARWDDAARAAALFAVDPAGLGGIAVRAHAGPVRDAWLALCRALLPPAAPLRRLPLHAGDDRLLGGLDLTATLHAGRPVAERGLLAECDGGVVVLAMAERLGAATAGRLAAVLDTGVVAVERDGLALRVPARIGVLALDEGQADDERPPAALSDRLAFAIELDAIGWRDVAASGHAADTIASARRRLAAVAVPDDRITALCEAAYALGVASLRAPLFALRAARAAAALAGRAEVAAEDAAVAARLVLAPRATRIPVPPPEDADPAPPPEQATADPPPATDEAAQQQGELADVVLDAARAAIPANLLALLQTGDAPRARTPAAGRVGADQQGMTRGRPAGTRAGKPLRGARVDVVETLRAAAPWQRLRRAEAPDTGPSVRVRADDLRVKRYRQHSATTTIFAVDASGSSALHRMAEAKGAVELLLADCYIRRDHVALLAFRGHAAELLLPPTRSLVRAKRCLAALPGGGGTPLAAGIDAALALADAIRRKGETPAIVLLTDGNANVARSGIGGRAQGSADALAAARRVRASALGALVIDTSPRPQPAAQALAAAMGARCIALPHADARDMARAIRADATRG
jgi:magnesium chelatase subunit D